MRGLPLVLLAVLLAVLLCSDRALSLQCYFCAGAQTTAQCSVMTCGEGQKVCYKGDLITTLLGGGKISLKQGGCGTSCDDVSKVIETVIHPTPGLGPLAPKFEMQGLSCCEKDLCNSVSRAGRSLGALAGGLLLSLGPALLGALL